MSRIGKTQFRAALIAITLGIPLISHAQPADITQLREETHQRLKSGHNPIGYSQTDEAMTIIHADPTQGGNLILFYTARSQDVNTWVSGNAQNGWNREHLWPQSRGTGSFPMKSDLHHLMPTDASVNQNRGNLNFDDGGSPEGEAADTFLDGDSFEPRDAIKGDVARAIFYMDLRYEGTSSEPDLMVVDSSPSTGGTTIGDLCTLFAWHQADPVSGEELQRNDLTEAAQGNRNVLIDEPGLVDAIYGPSCGAPVAPPSSSNPANAQTSLRVGTWNIANLHHESGVALRSGAFARDDQDYARLATLAEAMDLDIAALQEVGSPQAVARIFPASDYHIVMSDRYAQGDEHRPETERDIFTALVFAKDRFPTPPATRSLNALSIQHIGFDRDGSPSARPTRAGMVADLTLSGEPVRLLNVHLKSFCHRWSLDPVTDQSPSTGSPFSSRFDCRTLKAQSAILESWVEQQAAQGITTIILGDFNRQLNSLDSQQQPNDDIWRDLNDGTPNGLALEKGPLGLDTVCWPHHAQRYEDHIDFIVFDQNLRDLAAVAAPEKLTMGHETDPTYAEKARQRLSDHCPVVMELQE